MRHFFSNWHCLGSFPGSLWTKGPQRASHWAALGASDHQERQTQAQNSPSLQVPGSAEHEKDSRTCQLDDEQDHPSVLLSNHMGYLAQSQQEQPLNWPEGSWNQMSWSQLNVQASPSWNEQNCSKFSEQTQLKGFLFSALSCPAAGGPR